MRHRAVPASVRTKQVAQLKKIIKSAKSGKSPRASVAKRIKKWISNSHRLAKKHNVYGKLARVGYSMYNAKKGNTARIGYTPSPTQSIQYVD